jgi:hypothetical protein
LTPNWVDIDCDLVDMEQRLEMDRLYEARHFWWGGQLALETLSMCEPDLPLAASCSRGDPKRVSFIWFDTLTAEATWAPLNLLNFSHSFSPLKRGT